MLLTRGTWWTKNDIGIVAVNDKDAVCCVDRLARLATAVLPCYTDKWKKNEVVMFFLFIYKSS